MIMFISFCVDNFNNGKYIRDCLESVLGQTDKDYEVIVVDDGSTDDSGSICDEFQRLYTGRVSVFHQIQQGVSVARNTAITHANGDWIFFIDGDDVISPFSVELLKKLELKEHNYVQFGYKSFKDGQDYSQWDSTIKSTEIKNSTFILKRAIYSIAEEDDKRYRYPTILGKLFRKSFIISSDCRFVPGVVFSQDMIFCLNSFDHVGEVVLADMCLYGYRLNNSAIASRYSPKLHNDVELVKSAFFSALESLACKKDIDHYEKRVSLRIFAFVSKVIKCDILHPENKRPLQDKAKDFENLIDPATSQWISNLSMDDVDKTERLMLRFIKDRSFAYLRAYIFVLRRLQFIKKRLDVMIHRKKRSK